MATLPTPEENARNVLEVFKHFDRRPGDVVMVKSFFAVWIEWGLRIEDDLGKGLGTAEELGWVEKTGSGSYRLTPAGLDVM